MKNCRNARIRMLFRTIPRFPIDGTSRSESLHEKTDYAICMDLQYIPYTPGEVLNLQIKVQSPDFKKTYS